jgi:hypothetical protein
MKEKERSPRGKNDFSGNELSNSSNLFIESYYMLKEYEKVLNQHYDRSKDFKKLNSTNKIIYLPSRDRQLFMARVLKHFYQIAKPKLSESSINSHPRILFISPS